MFRLSILEIEAKLLSQQLMGRWQWMKMRKWPSWGRKRPGVRIPVMLTNQSSNVTN